MLGAAILSDPREAELRVMSESPLELFVENFQGSNRPIFCNATLAYLTPHQLHPKLDDTRNEIAVVTIGNRIKPTSCRRGVAGTRMGSSGVCIGDLEKYRNTSLGNGTQPITAGF